jgi:hypothetical protein
MKTTNIIFCSQQIAPHNRFTDTMPTTDDAISLTASCLCRAHVYSTTVPCSSLPLSAHICHCTTCRHITGSLYSSSTYWPDPPSSLDLSTLKRFSFTKAVDALSCPTCSSSMFFVFPGDDTKLGVLTGVLSNVDGELIQFGGSGGGMGFVRDTMDGGASPWLMHANVDGVPLKAFEDGGLRCEDAKEVSLLYDMRVRYTLTRYREPCRCLKIGHQLRI